VKFEYRTAAAHAFYGRNPYFTNEKLYSGEFNESWEYLGIVHNKKHSKEAVSAMLVFVFWWGVCSRTI